MHQIGTIDPYYRQVGFRIVPRHDRLKGTAIGKRHLKSIGLVYYVAICQNETVGRKDETRAGSVRLTGNASFWSPSGAPLQNINLGYRRTDPFRRASDGA